ncbi:hypothetical protein ACF09Y_33860 [Streptomyces massasporeus]|uniref:hypothetical protein n=1 Tax=Streptomyces massasporeus TaxID=67324 RepID=UPI0036FAF194
MVRRKPEKKRRPPFGMPKGIVLLTTPEGWRHSVLTVEGGMLCGRLADVPVNASQPRHGPPRQPWWWDSHTTSTKNAST